MKTCTSWMPWRWPAIAPRPWRTRCSSLANPRSSRARSDQLSIRDAEQRAANIRLAEGDIVTVEQTPVTFVWDTLQKFFRFNVGSSVVLF